jgi:hypothetical protein
MGGTEIFETGRHPPEVTPFSRGVAVGGAVLAHATVVTLGLWLSTMPRSSGLLERPQISRGLHLVWLTTPGPAGGGGGGGDRTSVAAPARQVGRERLTVPAARPESPAVEQPKESTSIPPITVPAQSTAAANETGAGAVSEPAPPADLEPRLAGRIESIDMACESAAPDAAAPMLGRGIQRGSL